MAAKLVDLAKMTTNTVGTGSLNLTGAVPPFLTYEQSGGATADSNISYAIYDPNGPGVEMGLGTYTNVAGVLTLTRDSVRRSSGTANTGKISVSGSAIVVFGPAAEDILTKPASNVVNSILVNGASASAFAFWSPTWTVDTTNSTLFGNFNSAAPVAGGLTGIILQLVGANTTAARVLVDGIGASPSTNLRRADGTYASPTAVQAFETIGIHNFMAHTGSAYTTARATFRADASEIWSPTANGTRFVWATTAAGATAAVARMFLGSVTGGLVMADSSGNAVTGDDEGPGTINASAYYISGVNIKGNLPATATNDSASAGHVGEYVVASEPSFTLGMTNNTPLNVCSISLTAGDYDVAGFVQFELGSGVSCFATFSSINTTSATLGSGSDTQPLFEEGGITRVGATATGHTLPRARVSIASTTTVYLVAQAIFSGGAMTVAGYISARRVR